MDCILECEAKRGINRLACWNVFDVFLYCGTFKQTCFSFFYLFATTVGRGLFFLGGDRALRRPLRDLQSVFEEFRQAHELLMDCRDKPE